MPRNKAAKRTAKTSKGNTLANVFAVAKRMEKELKQAPQKIVAFISHEVNAHKKHEAKLKNVLHQLQAKLHKSESRVAKAMKTKHTSTGKKLLKAAQNTYKDAVKSCKVVNKQLQAVSKTLETLVQKHVKLHSLTKHINQFEKEWKKSAKAQTNVKAKSPTKTTSKVKKSKTKAKKGSSAVEDLHQYTDNTNFENASYEEESELVA